MTEKGSEFTCEMISEGYAEGEVIFSKDAVCFYLVDPDTGILVEKNQDLEGQSIAEKILVIPSGKGSSVVQADGLYKLAMKNNAPKAVIIQYPDPVIVTGMIVMEIPMVHKVQPSFYEKVKDGDRIRIDTKNGKITVIFFFDYPGMKKINDTSFFSFLDR